jgi:ATP synthase protein I
MSRPENDERFVQEVRRQAERRCRQRTLGFWQGLGLVGAVGWMVALPAVAGALGGRWLDRHYGSGIFWTLGLLVAGVALGTLSAWRHVARELKP